MKSKILDEIKESKYFSVIIDSTPDSSHKEQTAFIFRYLREITKGTESATYRVLTLKNDLSHSWTL